MAGSHLEDRALGVDRAARDEPALAGRGRRAAEAAAGHDLAKTDVGGGVILINAPRCISIWILRKNQK
jgi:hypothetical protein